MNADLCVNDIVMANDTEVILDALRKEREEIHQKLMQIDRIIKRVKSFEYSGDKPDNVKQLPKEAASAIETPAINLFPKSSDIKVLVLRVFDLLQIASKLKDVQEEYNRLSGNKYNIREAMRTLNRAGLIKSVRNKEASRSILWVKGEWIENSQLIDKYKPDGFDLLHKPEDLIYE